MISHKFILYIILTLYISSLQKDISSFSNYEQIVLTNLEINFNIDFTEKTVHSIIIKTYFTALNDGEVIAFDTKALTINSIIVVIQEKT